jgi:hypothetical protein
VRVELIDALSDIDNETDFLHHRLQSGEARRLPPVMQRRNALAAQVAIGCNIGPTRMAAASGAECLADQPGGRLVNGRVA